MSGKEKNMTILNNQNFETGKVNPEINPIPTPPPNIPIPEIVPDPGKNRPETAPKPDIEPYTDPKVYPGKE